MPDIDYEANPDSSGPKQCQRAEHRVIALAPQNEVAAEIDVAGAPPWRELRDGCAVSDDGDFLRVQTQLDQRPFHVVAVNQDLAAVPVHGINPPVLLLERVNLVHRDHE